jgi:hypothetical protein
MTYLDLLEAHGGTSAPVLTGILANRPGREVLESENPDHHLWNNRGTWWCHFTLHRPDYTAERVRVSLKTRELAEARFRRDELLRRFAP